MQEGSMYVGVDVSKDELVVAVDGSPDLLSVPNTVAAVRRWLASLARGAKVAVESTGKYHQLLVNEAVRRQITVYVLNARDVYFYAKALGMRGKTDRIDAQVIARYLAEHGASLRPYCPPTPVQAEVQRLLDQRCAITDKRAALRQTLADSPGIGSAIAQLEQALQALLEAIDQRVQALIASDADLSRSQQLLQSICGIGPQSSAMLANLLCRLPLASADALVAYSGLDPRPCDSGRFKGRRRLSKRGRPSLRRQLYLAAMAASHSKVWRATYQQLRERGFQTTQALVILARKLLRVAYAVFTSGQPFDPAKVPQSS